MNKKLQNKPLTIQPQDITRLAQQGLQRALEARQLTELKTEELEQVAGGAVSTDLTNKPLATPVPPGTNDPILTGKIVPPPPILTGRLAAPPKK